MWVCVIWVLMNKEEENRLKLMEKTLKNCFCEIFLNTKKPQKKEMKNNSLLPDRKGEEEYRINETDQFI